MKNKKLAGLVLLVGLVITPILVKASDFRAGQQVSFTQAEKSTGNVYLAGANVNDAGAVTGDVTAAGGTVLINAAVTGDVLGAGGNVSVLGDVGGDVRIAGGNLLVQGAIKGDAVVAGGQINLLSKTIGGDAAIAGGSVSIESSIAGKLKVGGGDVYIDGPVAGDVEATASTLTLGPKADIKGNLSYKSPVQVTMEVGAIVHGTTTYTEWKKANAGDMKETIIAIFTAIFIFKFLAFLLAGLLFGLMLKRLSKEMVMLGTTNPLREFGRGLITLIVLPMFSLFLCVSLIGLPLGILGMLGFGALIIYMMIMTPIFLGSLIYKWVWHKDNEVSWKSIVLGVIFYFVLGVIPFIGWGLLVVASCITLGAALNVKMQVLKEWR